jgi:hypothetical protein
MTSSFPAIRMALALFAENDWAAADRLLHRVLEQPGKRDALRRELDLAQGNPATDWGELVSNESYELTDADDPAARELVLTCLWDALYPDQPPRNIDTSTYRIYVHDTDSKDRGFAADVNVGIQLDGRLEDIRESKPLANVSRIQRIGDVLEITFEPVGPHPFPSTLRKLLRAALFELLRGSPGLSGATKIEFHDTTTQVRSHLPL